MSNTLEHTTISALVQTATREIVQRTEAFLKSIEGKPVAQDAISVMFNGKTILMSKEDYALLKSQNEETRLAMKADMKARARQTKEGSKSGSQG